MPFEMDCLFETDYCGAGKAQTKDRIQLLGAHNPQGVNDNGNSEA